jgi:hypothetical protein
MPGGRHGLLFELFDCMCMYDSTSLVSSPTTPSPTSYSFGANSTFTEWSNNQTI